MQQFTALKAAQEAYAEQSRVTETGVFAATVEWWDREGEAEGTRKQ